MLPAMAGLACFLACMALASVDEPDAGGRAGARTLLAAALVAISAAYFVLRLATFGP
jgi:hypothetical protein